MALSRSRENRVAQAAVGSLLAAEDGIRDGIVVILVDRALEAQSSPSSSGSSSFATVPEAGLPAGPAAVAPPLSKEEGRRLPSISFSLNVYCFSFRYATDKTKTRTAKEQARVAVDWLTHREGRLLEANLSVACATLRANEQAVAGALIPPCAVSLALHGGKRPLRERIHRNARPSSSRFC